MEEKNFDQAQEKLYTSNKALYLVLKFMSDTVGIERLGTPGKHLY